MSPLADTLINIELFAFVGLMIWLYLRPSALEKEQGREHATKDRKD